MEKSIAQDAQLGRRLLLIRHSAPEIVPGVPAREWRLCEEGRRRCEALAERVHVYAPRVIVSSVEPKARETAELVAARLGVAVQTADGLHEHERDNVGFLGRAEFDAAVGDFFARPDDLVLGRETAAQALDRFNRAVVDVLATQRSGAVAIVTHGTVMSLFVAARTGVDPFAFWRDLALPDFAVLDLPS